MKSSKKLCSLAVGLAILMSPAVLFAQTNSVMEKYMNAVENAGFTMTQSVQDIKNIIAEVPVPAAAAAEKFAKADVYSYYCGKVVRVSGGGHSDWISSITLYNDKAAYDPATPYNDRYLSLTTADNREALKLVEKISGLRFFDYYHPGNPISRTGLFLCVSNFKEKLRNYGDKTYRYGYDITSIKIYVKGSLLYNGPIISVRSKKTMDYYVNMVQKVAGRLTAQPNGAPERYVNGVRYSSYRLSRNYAYISRCQEINGEGVEWEDIGTALDNVRNSVAWLKYWVKFISASPNYVKWHGHELATALNGIDRLWDDWEYAVNQIGT